MIYTFENFSWSRPSTIHLSLQIIRHCFSQIWPEPIRNCISLMGQREKISLWCQGELVNLKWSGQTDCNSQNYLPFSDIFGICAKYLSPNLRLTNFDKPLMFAVKLGKLVWILADAYWLRGAILQPSLVHNHHPELTGLLPVSGAVAGAQAGEKWLVEFEIRDHSKPVFLISFPPQKKA